MVGLNSVHRAATPSTHAHAKAKSKAGLSPLMRTVPYVGTREGPEKRGIESTVI